MGYDLIRPPPDKPLPLSHSTRSKLGANPKRRRVERVADDPRTPTADREELLALLVSYPNRKRFGLNSK